MLCCFHSLSDFTLAFANHTRISKCNVPRNHFHDVRCVCVCWISLFSIYSCSRVRPNENGNRTTSIQSTYLSKLHQKTYEKDNAINSFHCESHVHRIGGKERREGKKKIIERICGHLNFSFAALFFHIG